VKLRKERSRQSNAEENNGIGPDELEKGCDSQQEGGANKKEGVSLKRKSRRSVGL